MKPIHIGTSGWQYEHWAGRFYPKKTKTSQQFDFYQKHFNTVELNNSFYRLPSKEAFENRRKHSKKNFLFAVKANRFITHNKKLKDPKETTKLFFKNAAGLKEKLGPILFQLPPTWKVNVARLADFLKALPKKHRYVFEFRNETWYTDEVYALLRKYHCAFCIYELEHHFSPMEITAGFVYVRLHGPAEKYAGNYSKNTLKDWAAQCVAWAKAGKEVFVYFDNDQRAYAAFNAITLQEMIKTAKVQRREEKREVLKRKFRGGSSSTYRPSPEVYEFPERRQVHKWHAG